MKKIILILVAVLSFSAVESYAQEKFDKYGADLWYEIKFTDAPQFNHEGNLGLSMLPGFMTFIIDEVIPSQYREMYWKEADKVIRNGGKGSYRYNDKSLDINLNTGITTIKCREFILTLHNLTSFEMIAHREAVVGK